MRKTTLLIVLLLLFSVSACSYAKDRWKSYTAEVKRQAEKPRTKEGICRSRGGVLYNEQCYTSSPSNTNLSEADCRLRGGLYIDEQCLTISKSTVSAN